jgi:hypothetical protein
MADAQGTYAREVGPQRQGARDRRRNGARYRITGLDRPAKAKVDPTSMHEQHRLPWPTHPVYPEGDQAAPDRAVAFELRAGKKVERGFTVMTHAANERSDDFGLYPDEELPKPPTHLERFRVYQTRLNWVFATIPPVLLTLWFGSLEVRSSSLRELQTNFLHVLEIRQTQSNSAKEHSIRLNEAQMDQTSRERRIINEKEKYGREKKDYKKTWREAKSKFFESKSEAVEFDFLEFRLPISTSLAPAVWSLVLLGFLGFALTQRRRAYGQIAAYIQSCRCRYPGKSLVPGVAGEAAFMLAPIPPLPPTAPVSESDIATVLGWQGEAVQQRARLMAALFAVLALIQFRVLWLALEFNGNLVQLTRVYALPVRPLAIGACFACALGSIMLAVHWLRAPMMATRAPHGQLLSRRNFLVSAGAVAIAFSADRLYNNYLRSLGIHASNVLPIVTGYAPRYRRRTKPALVETGLPNGLAFDPSSKDLVYIDANGRMRAKGSRVPAQPTRQSLTQAIAWVERSAPTRWSCWRVEEYALDLVEQSEIEDACKLLFAAVRLNLRRPPEALNCRADREQPTAMWRTPRRAAADGAGPLPQP